MITDSKVVAFISKRKVNLYASLQTLFVVYLMLLYLLIYFCAFINIGTFGIDWEYYEELINQMINNNDI